MSILDTLSIRSYYKNKIREVETRIQQHESRVQEFDQMIGHKDSPYGEPEYAGNKFRAYKDYLDSIQKKIAGIDNWGVYQACMMVEVLSTFSIGHGLQIKTTRPDMDTEYNFVSELLHYNGLDADSLLDFARETETEGKLLLNYSFDPDYKWQSVIKPTDKNKKEKINKMTGMIKTIHIPYSQKDYTVIQKANDYRQYEKVYWIDKNTGKQVTIEEPAFTYRKYGGRPYNINDPVPKLWRCLTQIENYDKVIRDIRRINNLFSCPVPVIEAVDEKAAKYIAGAVSDKNYRFGKLLTIVGKFIYVVPDSAGVAMLFKEKVELQKTISGATGIPAHFFEPEIMSNKRLSENEMEFMWASTLTMRNLYKSAYNEMIKKAASMYTLNTNIPIDAENVWIEVQQITQGDWDRLIDVLLPLKREKALSLTTLLSHFPGIEAEEEIKKINEEKENNIEDIRNGSLFYDPEKGGFDGDKNNKVEN